MAIQVPPKKNNTFTFEIALTSQDDMDVFQTSVTLAAGDVKVSKDGGAFLNIGTLPLEIGTTGVLTVALTADEMNADRVAVLFHDALGSEWQDLLVTIHTVTTNQIDDLATATAKEIADEVLKRGVSNVEDSADATSLTALILAAFESAVSGTTWTIRKTGGGTFTTKTVTVDSGADPITGVT